MLFRAQGSNQYANKGEQEHIMAMVIIEGGIWAGF